MFRMLTFEPFETNMKSTKFSEQFVPSSSKENYQLSSILKKNAMDQMHQMNTNESMYGPVVLGNITCGWYTHKQIYLFI